jgi:hypothetical protein
MFPPSPHTVSSLHIFLCPTVKAMEHFLFHLSLNSTHCLLILNPLGLNIYRGTAKQLDGSIQMFDLLHFISRKFYAYKFLCPNSFTNPTRANVLFFVEDKPASCRYQYTVFCVEYRFGVAV